MDFCRGDGASGGAAIERSDPTTATRLAFIVATPTSRFATLVVLAAMLASPGAALAASEPLSWALFTQAGAAGSVTTLSAGASVDWPWRHETRVGTLSGYGELAFGRWHSSSAGQEGTAWVSQLGVTPVIRLWPMDSRWFVEAGIGANVLMPVFRTSEKRFSTAFNFGDHLAVGLRFGEQGRHEVSLRGQHFSNAGIRDPNPGQNFVQLRYSHRFGAR